MSTYTYLFFYGRLSGAHGTFFPKGVHQRGSLIPSLKWSSKNYEAIPFIQRMCALGLYLLNHHS
ncbi:hypothetical protein M2146_002449 [Lachnospiraceae bacterium PF1-22]